MSSVPDNPVMDEQACRPQHWLSVRLLLTSDTWETARTNNRIKTPAWRKRCSACWARCLRESARLLQLAEAEVLSPEERLALDGKRSLHETVIPDVTE